MFKKILAALMVMLAFTNTVLAQSDASITWSVSGIVGIKEIEMDAKFTTRYIAINGVYTTTQNFSVPFVGTCFQTVSGGALCNFGAPGGLMMVVNLDPSLAGTLKAFDVNHIQRDSGILTLKNIL